METTITQLYELARLYGVETAYYDLNNQHQLASPDALLAILRALGAPVASLEDVPPAIRDHQQAAWQQPLLKIGNLGIIVMSLLLTYSWPWEFGSYWGWYNLEVNTTYVTVGYTILTLWFAGSVFLNYLAFKEGRLNQLLAGAVPLLAVLGFVLTPVAPVIFNIYFLVLSIARIREGLRTNRLSTVNEGLLMLVVLIAVRFFSSEFSLVVKGLVMILLGVGFWVANIMIIRRREVQNV